MLINLFFVLAGMLAIPGQSPSETQNLSIQNPSLSYTADRMAMGRCLNGLAGARGVIMRCTLDGQGRANDCEIANPSPAVMRNERVFQCMASRMHFSFSDGSSTEGYPVQFQLGGRTVLGEEQLRQAERGARERGF